MGEICRVLKLNEAERDILVYAAVRLMTCFDDFPVGNTSGRNDRAMFIAMAIDRPCSMVTNALAANEKLRRYEVLDSDGDLERNSPFRNYLDNGDGEMLEGQFYKKTPTDDALPWDYYGKLAEEHGGILRKMISSAKSGRRGVNILFYGEPGTGTVMVGEVSQCNDDTTDNRFYEQIGRFPDIIEDEEPLHLLCSDYTKFLC